MQVEGARQIDSVTTLEPPADASPEATRLGEISSRAMAIGHGCLARLAVRRAGHAPLHARRDARRGAAARRDEHGRSGSEGEERLHPGRLPARLGARRIVLRPAGRHPRAEPCALAHHPHVRALHRRVRLRADVVAVHAVPLHRGARHRRRMGGGRFAALGDVAEALASVDRGDAADRRQPRHPARRAHRRASLARAAPARGALRLPRRACCRPFSCSGFAATCPSPRRGRPPRARRAGSVRGRATCSAARSRASRRARRSPAHSACRGGGSSSSGSRNISGVCSSMPARRRERSRGSSRRHSSS